MSVYLDASVLVSLFILDPNSRTALRKMRQVSDTLVVSDFGAAEFASAVSKRVRMKLTPTAIAQAVFAAFDTWIAASAELVALAASDVAASARMLRRLDSNLRTPHALHLALVQRIGATLFTLDTEMKGLARKEGVSVI